MAEKTLGQVAVDEWIRNGDWQAVADAVEAAIEARRWRPIESAPKEQRSILAYAPFIKSQLMVYWCLTDACWKYFGPHNRRVEHTLTMWTPIPAPPQEVERA